MSQRECAGFNWPRFPVSTGDPLSIGPEAIARAACTGKVHCGVPSVRGVSTVPCSPSDRFGVAHAAAWFNVIFGVVKFSPG
jgi:hypothetical protein